MVDMFGTSDLQLTTDGRDVVRGIEGFHSRAFGDFEDLFGLVTPDIESIVGIKKGSTVSQRGDTRKRKQAAILEYVAAIRFSRAILG
jgi:DnaJ-class molecular chaperone